jgi:SNF2 family DNA or RNA helicase
MAIQLKNGFELFPHQQKTVDWMKEREELRGDPTVWGLKGGIVSLTMGLGKSLIALAYSLQNKGSFPTLIVASKTVMLEWKTEGVEKFFGSEVKVLYLHKDFLGSKIGKIDRKQIQEYDLVITTYDVCMAACKKGKYFEDCFEYGERLMAHRVVAIHLRSYKDANLPKLKGINVIYGTPWERVICDESQRFANPTTITYKSMMAIYGKFKWCLTGTPIRNYNSDIWAQLRFCGYTGVDNKTQWSRTGKVKFREHELISSIFLMDYADAGISMPKKIENDVYVELDGQHREIYAEILDKTQKVFKKMLNDLCSFACVLAWFTRLRQSAIAPFLITPDAKRKKKGLEQNDEEWNVEKFGAAGFESAKITKVIEILKEVTEIDNPNKPEFPTLKRLAVKSLYANFDHQDIKERFMAINMQDVNRPTKVIVFSTFTSCLDLLSEAVKEAYPNFKFVQVDGSTKNRIELFDQFKKDIDTQGLFLSYKVGSEGLNLTEATHCICIEPWWTDAVHAQAKARIWRTGQTNQVQFHNIIAKDTIEEKIVELCRYKNDMASSYLKGTDLVAEKPCLNVATMGKLLGVRPGTDHHPVVRGSLMEELSMD